MALQLGRSLVGRNVGVQSCQNDPAFIVDLASAIQQRLRIGDFKSRVSLRFGEVETGVVVEESEILKDLHLAARPIPESHARPRRKEVLTKLRGVTRYENGFYRITEVVITGLNESRPVKFGFPLNNARSNDLWNGQQRLNMGGKPDCSVGQSTQIHGNDP